MNVLEQAYQTLQSFRASGRSLREFRMTPETYARLASEIAEQIISTRSVTTLFGIPVVVTEDLDVVGRSDLVSA